MIARTGDPCDACGGSVPIGGHTHSEVSEEERERVLDELLAELDRLGREDEVPPGWHMGGYGLEPCGPICGCAADTCPKAICTFCNTEFPQYPRDTTEWTELHPLSQPMLPTCPDCAAKGAGYPYREPMWLRFLRLFDTRKINS